MKSRQDQREARQEAQLTNFSSMINSNPAFAASPLLKRASDLAASKIPTSNVNKERGTPSSAVRTPAPKLYL